MMENYDRTMELVETAQDSAGRSSEQFAKYSDTLEYKLNKLKTSWEQLRTSFIQSDIFKNAIDGITNLVDKLNEISPKKLIASAAVFVTFGKYALQNILKGLSGAGQSFSTTLGQVLSNATKSSSSVFRKIAAWRITPDIDLTEFDAGKKQLEQKIEQIKQDIRAAELDTSLNINIEEKAEELKARTQEYEENYGSIEKQMTERADRIGQASGQAFATALTAVVTTALVSDNPLDALWASAGAVMTTLIPQLLTTVISAIGTAEAAAVAAEAAVTLGISALIALVVGGIAAIVKYISQIDRSTDEQKWDKIAKSVSEAADSSKEWAESAKAGAKESEEAVKSAEKLQDRFNELNNKAALTTEEQEEYNKLVEEIRDEFPEVVTYYNEVTGELQVQNSLWSDILEKQKTLAEGEVLASTAVQGAALDIQAQANKNTYYSNLEDITGIPSYLIEKKNGNISTNDLEKAAEENVDAIGKVADYLTEFLETANTENKNKYESNAQTFFEAARKSVDTAQVSEKDDAVLGWFLEGEGVTQADIDAFRDNFSKAEELIKRQAKKFGVDTTEEFLKDSEGQGLIDILKNSLRTNEEINKSIEDARREELEREEQIHQQRISNYKEEYALLNEEGTDLTGVIYGSVMTQRAEINDKNQENSFSDYLKQFQAKDIGDVKGLFDVDDKTELGSKNYGYFQKGLIKIYGNQQEAAKAFQEAFDTYGSWSNALAGLAAQIDQYDSDEKAKEDADKIAKAIEKNDLANDAYANLAKSISQQNINALKEILSGTDVTYDNINDVLKPFQDAYSDAIKEATGFGIDEGLAESWDTKALSAFSERVGAAIDAGVNEGFASDFYNALSKGLKDKGISSEGITSVLSGIDWENVDLTNLNTYEKRFLDMMHEIVGESFNEEDWKEYFRKVVATGEEFDIFTYNFNNRTAVEDFKESLNEIYDTTVDLTDKTSDAISSAIKNGQISYKEYRDLVESFKDAESNLNVDDFVTAVDGGYKLNIDALKNALESQITDQDGLLKKAQEQLKIGKQNLQDEINQLKGKEQTDAIKAQLESLELQYKELEELGKSDKQLLTWFAQDRGPAIVQIIDTINQAIKDGTEAKEDNEDVTEDLTEAEEELREAIQGSDYFDSETEKLYNYTTALEKLQDDLTKTKDNLENLEDIGQANQLLEDYGNTIHNQQVLLEAENQTLEQTVKNIGAAVTTGLKEKLEALNAQYPGYNISTDTSNFFKQDELTGRYIINYDLINNATMPDDFKTWVVEQIEQANKYLDQLDDNKDKEEEVRKEIDDMRKKYLDDYVSLEDEVIGILKDKYQEEIDATKEKYEAIEEADNDYLDALEEAIEKQRKLRDTENKWNDLAQKERKLSLLQRDTTAQGSSETLKLQKEIEDDRQELLDDSVDNILDNLKETYEMQKEWRDRELELLELEIDEAALTREAVSIISSWNSPEDAMAWFYQNSPEVASMSNAKLEQSMEEWRQNYNSKYFYENFSESELKAQLDVSSSEIASALATYNTTVANVQNSLDSQYDTVVENISELQKKVDELKDKLDGEDEGIGDTYSKTIPGYKNTYEELPLTTKTSYSNAVEAGQAAASLAQAGYNASIFQGNDGYWYVNSGTRVKTSGKTSTIPKSLGDNLYATRGEAERAAASIAQTKQGLSPRIIEENGLYRVTTETTSDEKPNIIESIQAALRSGVQKSLEVFKSSLYGKLLGYDSGGLVNYTGPAWVDGTPAKPEAFLSADDTRRIGEAAQLLADLPILNNTNSINDVNSQIVGDTNIEVHINVDSISSDYDVDQAVERVKYDILKAANPQGSSVILRK